ncbi:MAG TPA: DUF6644 family protein [Bryobacteraceae bacterium]|nr:DUF6644 family protein [Bryobacteraceae bacterium]
MIAYDPATNPLNNNEWAFPLLEIIHIAGFTLSIGTIALVDLRLLGLGFRRLASAELARQLAPWTLIGLIVMLISGPLIFSSDPNMYLHNISFKFKMVALAVAILYHYTIHNWTAYRQPAPAVGKLVGGVSVLLWVSVVAGGLFIAFF